MKFTEHNYRVLHLRQTNSLHTPGHNRFGRRYVEKGRGGLGQAEQESGVNSGSSESTSDNVNRSTDGKSRELVIRLIRLQLA